MRRTILLVGLSIHDAKLRFGYVKGPFSTEDGVKGLLGHPSRHASETSLGWSILGNTSTGIA